MLQLRLKCLEALLQLLQLVDADSAAAAAWTAAAAAAPQQQQAGGVGSNGSSSSSSSGSLSADVSACLSGVVANDPSMAHKALAGQAAEVLSRINSR